ncbi:MAG: hypothetical protein QNJ72_08375 [Pleurocapsa sp. MO_226.B13]|nr:hypothetical protein [Pleurocapsa sp. MO_226.B13]
MKYLGFEFIHQQHEDCMLSWAEFTFDDDGVLMVGESPRSASNFEDYYYLREDTARVHVGLKNGGDFEELVKTYRFEYSHIED